MYCTSVTQIARIYVLMKLLKDLKKKESNSIQKMKKEKYILI